MESLLKGFPVVIRIPIAWGEMDSLQHVNNIIYFRYFESARMAYFDRIAVWDLMRDTGIGPILASTNCKFRVPLTYPDNISIGTKVSDVGEDRFSMQYIVVSDRWQKIAAEGEGVIVSYDYNSKTKAPLPDALRHRIADLEQVERQG